MIRNLRSLFAASFIVLPLGAACTPFHNVPPPPPPPGQVSPNAWSVETPSELDPIAPPKPLELSVAEPGTVAFLSSVAPGTSQDAADSASALPDAAYAFGEPLYAEIQLPLTLDEYRERYGFDEFELSVKSNMGHGNDWADEAAKCDEPITVHGRTLTVSLLRDARIPADVDVTTCMVRAIDEEESSDRGYENNPRGPSRWSPVLVELHGWSKTMGIRARTIASSDIDMRVTPSKMVESIEAYALLDRRLQRDLLTRDSSTVKSRGANSGRRHGRHDAGGDDQLASAIPSSRMPNLDAPALAALASANEDGSRRALRAVITSDTWQYARDVKAKRRLDRFVVGVAAFRTPQGKCELQNAVWMQHLGGKEPSGALWARVARASQTEPIAIECGRVLGG